jgi:hypothetical protein
MKKVSFLVSKKLPLLTTLFPNLTCLTKNGKKDNNQNIMHNQSSTCNIQNNSLDKHTNLHGPGRTCIKFVCNLSIKITD